MPLQPRRSESSTEAARSPGSTESRVDRPESEATQALGAAISRETAQLYLLAFGQEPRKVQTHIRSDFAVCVLRDVLSPDERALLADGGREQVEGRRKEITDARGEEIVSLVEREAGLPVQNHIAYIRVLADVVLHFFLFEEGASLREWRPTS